MSQKEEQNNDANNELMNKLSNIFGNNNDKKENNAEKSDELKNYIDGEEGEEIKPTNKRHNDNNEQESQDVGNGNSISKTTICRIIGWCSIAIGIASIALGIVISPFFFIATAISAVSLCINIGIVNHENQKEYLQQYIATNDQKNAKEHGRGEGRYRNNEKHFTEENKGNDLNADDGKNKLDNDMLKNEPKALNEPNVLKYTRDGLPSFLDKKNKKIDDNEPNYTKQNENRARQKENSADGNRF